MKIRYQDTLLNGLDAEKKKSRFQWSNGPLFRHDKNSMFKLNPKIHKPSVKLKVDIPPFLKPPFCVWNDKLELVHCMTRDTLGPGHVSDSHFDGEFRKGMYQADNKHQTRENYQEDMKDCVFKVTDDGQLLSEKEVPAVSNSIRFCITSGLAKGIKIPATYNNETQHLRFHEVIPKK